MLKEKWEEKDRKRYIIDTALYMCMIYVNKIQKIDLGKTIGLGWLIQKRQEC